MLLATFSAPFGTDVAIFAPFLELTAEPTPIGEHRVFVSPNMSVPGLRHSTVYHDTEVTRRVLSWIAGNRSGVAPVGRFGPTGVPTAQEVRSPCASDNGASEVE